MQAMQQMMLMQQNAMMMMMQSGMALQPAPVTAFAEHAADAQDGAADTPKEGAVAVPEWEPSPRAPAPAAAAPAASDSK